MHADLKRSSSFTRHSVGSPSGRVSFRVQFINLICSSLSYLDPLQSQIQQTRSHQWNLTEQIHTCALVRLATLWCHDLLFVFLKYLPYTGILHLDDMATSEEIWLHLFRSRALIIIGEDLCSCTNQRYLCSMFQERQDGQVWVFTS